MKATVPVLSETLLGTRSRGGCVAIDVHCATSHNLISAAASDTRRTPNKSPPRAPYRRRTADCATSHNRIGSLADVYLETRTDGACVVRDVYLGTNTQTNFIVRRRTMLKPRHSQASGRFLYVPGYKPLVKEQGFLAPLRAIRSVGDVYLGTSLLSLRCVPRYKNRTSCATSHKTRVGGPSPRLTNGITRTTHAFTPEMPQFSASKQAACPDALVPKHTWLTSNWLHQKRLTPQNEGRAPATIACVPWTKSMCAPDQGHVCPGASGYVLWLKQICDPVQASIFIGERFQAVKTPVRSGIHFDTFVIQKTTPQRVGAFWSSDKGKGKGNTE